MEFDAATPATHAVLENSFRMAQVLQLQKKYDQAVDKYREVCTSMGDILRKNPESQFHLIPMALDKVVEIYREKNDLDRALAFMKIERKFLESMHSKSEDDRDHRKDKHQVTETLAEMEEAFEMKPSQRSPEDIVKMLMDAKKQQDEENQKKNMQRLLEIVEERKRRLENSRWERFMDWLGNHPVSIVIGMVLALGVFMTIMLVKLGIGQRPPVIGRKERPHVDHEQKGKPRVSQESLDRMKGKIREMRKDFDKNGEPTIDHEL